MIVVMRVSSKESEINAVKSKLEGVGFKTHLIQGVERIVIGAIGDKRALPSLGIDLMEGVEKIVHIMNPYKLVSKEVKEKTIIQIGSTSVGGDIMTVVAGPCAVESEEQLMESAKAVKEAGATMLRGGAFKPRTSPYSFQGLQEEGLKLLRDASKIYDLPIVTEVMNIKTVELVAEYADVLQIGARNMQNFDLLKEVGRMKKPVVLKRGLSATLEEFLMAAEYIMSEGNYEVILCERGIRTFETATRNTLDLSIVPLIKQTSHLPVIVDPSHATGTWKLVAPMSKGSLAVGADGLMIEVHPNPPEALCDGSQSLTPENFNKLMQELQSMHSLLHA
ncbi:MAG: 3-deoxy-7-phosphoheptulonate synthase [Bacillota bacterium]|nr:3-deoxy-7-phosphoheptulonate synthase [Bacillota bacterium]